MSTVLHVLLGALMFCITLARAEQDYRVVCYYGGWSAYRHGNGQFDIENIDPSLCTHILYAFVALGENNTIISVDPARDLPDNGADAFGRLVRLKDASPETKIMASIGGWNQGSSQYSAMATTDEGRNQFAENAVSFLKTYGFDGLDIDWEYPCQRGGAETDKNNFPELLRVVQEKFQPDGYVLSIATGSTSDMVDLSYNVSEISKYVDFINLMTYDFHGLWDSVTGEGTPLYPRQNETDDEKQRLNVNVTIDYWLNQGAPAAKLNLGLGAYGRSFTLANASDAGLGAPVTGGGTPGPFTKEVGNLAYYEICALPTEWIEVWNDEQKVPYAVKGDQWVGYDNPESIRIKSEYLKSKQLGGAMIWTLENEDSKGLCGNGSNPLLTVINTVLNGGVLPTVEPPTPNPDNPTTTPIPTPPPPDTSVCTKEGYVQDPHDCQVFYNCVLNDDQEYEIIKYKCGDGAYFDSSIDACNFTENVECNVTK